MRHDVLRQDESLLTAGSRRSWGSRRASDGNGSISDHHMNLRLDFVFWQMLHGV